MELLKAENIVKQYSNHRALDDVTISIPKQSIYGLLGPNGAGKTTLIRIITQIINPDNGQVFLEGKPITEEDVRKIGYLPEERGLYKKMKVGDQLLFLAGLKGLSKSHAKTEIRKWFDKLQIDGWWNKKVEDLSKGMGQKIQFIATVLHNPKLIILDEPFSGFDPVNANLIKNEIIELKNNGATVIFSTHRMESVEELCDHIAMINHSKKILDGSTHDIKESFKSDTFMVTHQNRLENLDGPYELAVANREENGLLYSEIIAPGVKSPNELLAALMPKVEIHSFIEKIPSMNDIFITKAKEGGSNE
ncbi:MAG: ATP-binding cassette domain-containing protein [Cyclobacteriaceae bacterium]